MTPVAMYDSGEPLEGDLAFLASLTTADGMPVAHAAINVALVGGGSLQPDGGRPGLPFVFQETDGERHHPLRVALGPWDALARGPQRLRYAGRDATDPPAAPVTL